MKTKVVLIVILLAFTAVLAVMYKKSLVSKNMEGSSAVNGKVLPVTQKQSLKPTKSEPGAPVDFKDQVVTEAKSANGGEVFSYAFHGKIKNLYTSTLGLEIELDSSSSGLPKFVANKDTQVSKTTFNSKSAAKVEDIHPSQFVSIAAYYIVKDKKWVTTNVFITEDSVEPQEKKN